MNQHPAKPFRILSLEGGMAAFAVYSLISGILRREAISIYWGGIILCGLIVLHLVRRKDWQKHWADLEAEQRANRAGADSSTHPEKDRRNDP